MEAIDRQKRAHLRDLLLITRAAGSDKKGFKAILKELDGNG